MKPPEPIHAAIGKVTPLEGGRAWNVALMPDNTTWLTVHAHQLHREPPMVGDTLTIMPPYVIAHNAIGKG